MWNDRSKCGELNCSEKMDEVHLHLLANGRPSSDRAAILEAFADLERSGMGGFDGPPNLEGEIFRLHPGEAFWLGANEIIRIK
jgi:hypothetical protein